MEKFPGFEQKKSPIKKLVAMAAIMAITSLIQGAEANTAEQATGKEPTKEQLSKNPEVVKNLLFKLTDGTYTIDDSTNLSIRTVPNVIALTPSERDTTYEKIVRIERKIGAGTLTIRDGSERSKTVATLVRDTIENPLTYNGIEPREFRGTEVVPQASGADGIADAAVWTETAKPGKPSRSIDMLQTTKGFTAVAELYEEALRVAAGQSPRAERD